MMPVPVALLLAATYVVEGLVLGVNPAEQTVTVSHKEIAGMLDIEESTSRSQYTRAKAMLEDILIKKKIIQKQKKKTTFFGAVSPG